MKEEIWKDVIGYEGLYQVSCDGQIRSYDKLKFNGFKEFMFKGRILRQRRRPNGYMDVSLHKERSFKPVLIHRIVASAFIPNPDNKPYVNHINCDKSDNRIQNLEWCTPLENGTHAKMQGRYRPISKKDRDRVSRMAKSKFSKPVLQFDITGNLLAEFPSANEAHRQLGISQGLISNVCRGLKENTHNYVFKYKV